MSISWSKETSTVNTRFHTAWIDEQIYPALSCSASPLSRFQLSKQQQEVQPVALPEHVARVYRVSRRVSVHMLHMIKTFAMDFFSSRDSLI